MGKDGKERAYHVRNHGSDMKGQHMNMSGKARARQGNSMTWKDGAGYSTGQGMSRAGNHMLRNAMTGNEHTRQDVTGKRR